MSTATTIEESAAAAAAAAEAASISKKNNNNSNNEKNKKPNLEQQLFRIHGYSIQRDDDDDDRNSSRNKLYHFIHSLTFKKLTSPIPEFEEVIPVRLERRRFDSFDAMNCDANRLGAYQSSVENDVTNLNDSKKIRQFSNEKKINMQQIPGRNPIMDLFALLGLTPFVHSAIKVKGDDIETRRMKGTLDTWYQIAASSGTKGGYSVVHRVIDYVSTGFCSRHAEYGTAANNHWLYCCPLQPPERLQELGQRLLKSSYQFSKEKDAQLKREAGKLMISAAIRHSALQEEAGGLAEAVRIADLRVPVTDDGNQEGEGEGEEKEGKRDLWHARQACQKNNSKSKEEKEKDVTVVKKEEEEEEDTVLRPVAPAPTSVLVPSPAAAPVTVSVPAAPTDEKKIIMRVTEPESSSSSSSLSSSSSNKTFNETMTLLQNAAGRLDILEQKASQIGQTASARDYYREAAYKLFADAADAKFWETVEKRGRWNKK